MYELYHTWQQMLLSCAMNRSKLWRGPSTLSGCYSHLQASNMWEIMSPVSWTLGHQWKYLELTLIFSNKRKLTRQELILKCQDPITASVTMQLDASKSSHYLKCLDSVIVSKQTVHWIQLDVLVILLSFTRQLEVCTSNHHSICRARHAWANYWSTVLQENEILGRRDF